MSNNRWLIVRAHLDTSLWTAVTCHRFGNSASSRAVAGDKSPAEGKRRQVGALQKRAVSRCALIVPVRKDWPCASTAKRKSAHVVLFSSAVSGRFFLMLSANILYFFQLCHVGK